jgi:cytidine diphosphoramidate kinase
MIYWFTGQPGAGKTTLALELINRLDNCIHIDGDNLRDILKNYDYTPEGRIKNISNVITIARYLDYKKFNVIISVVAPFRDLRESLKESNEVTEIFVHTNEKRGREHYFSKNYEKPLKNFTSIDTTNKTAKECIDLLLKSGKKRKSDETNENNKKKSNMNDDKKE